MQTLFQSKKLEQNAGPFKLVTELSGELCNYALFAGDECCGLFTESTDQLNLELFQELDIESFTALVWTDVFTLVPNMLWSSDQRQDYAKLLFTDNEEMVLMDQKVEAAQSTALYGLDQNLHDQLSAISNRLKIANPVPFLIGYLMDIESADNKLYAHFSGRHLLISVLKGGNLMHCTVYNVTNTDEVIYYLSYVCKVYELDTSIAIGGNFDENMLDVLSSYFYSIQPLVITHIDNLDNPSKYNSILNPLAYANR